MTSLARVARGTRSFWDQEDRILVLRWEYKLPGRQLKVLLHLSSLLYSWVCRRTSLVLDSLEFSASVQFTRFCWKSVCGILMLSLTRKMLLSFVASFFLLVEICGAEPGLIYNDPEYSFIYNATTAPKQSSAYDYIVVGGGTAGCPIAATLSANFRVLLLERGGLPYADPNVREAVGYTSIQIEATESPTRAGQRFISEEGVVNLRANVLGGGSAVNAGFFTYASPEDVVSLGWDAELVNASYDWVARVVAGFPEVKEWQSGLKQGLLEAGIVPDSGDTYQHVKGTKVGGSIFDLTGHRHTAADLLQYADPTRLTVYTGAYVERILLEGVPGSTGRRAYGVEYRDVDGVQHMAQVQPNGEVVLSAGALGSPQLLLLSGIGPASKLAPVGIQVEVELEGVGEGLADNPKNSVFVPSPSAVEGSFVQVVGWTPYGNIIEGASGKGILILAGGIDLSTRQPSRRSLELVHELARSLQNSSKAQFVQGGYLLQKVYRPKASGWLRLRSADVKESPIVRFNYYNNPEDVQACTQGIRLLKRVVDSHGFSNFRYREGEVPETVTLFPDLVKHLFPTYLNDTPRLEQWCKDTVSTIWHYHGGCLKGSVVDEQYKVKHVKGLRVVDGSTWSISPGANPQATVMMLGRYVGVGMVMERLGETTAVDRRCNTTCPGCS